MKTTIQEIYKCEFCNKLYQVKSACERHELICSHNPINDRPCFHCYNLEKKDAEIEDQYTGFSGQLRKVQLFHCSVKQHFVYTPKNESKGNRFYTEEPDNIPMPTICEVFDDNDKLHFGL